MENLTVVGMKELNQKVSKMERSLEGIDRSLSQIMKILNRQVPKQTPTSEERSETDGDEEMSDV